MDRDFIRKFDERAERELSVFDKESSDFDLDDHLEGLQESFDKAVELSNKIERTTINFEQGYEIYNMFNIHDKYIFISEARTLCDFECLSYSLI